MSFTEKSHDSHRAKNAEKRRVQNQKTHRQGIIPSEALIKPSEKKKAAPKASSSSNMADVIQGAKKSAPPQPNTENKPAGVIPTNNLKANQPVSDLLTMASENSAFQNVMKSFYDEQNHVYIDLDQLKDKSGQPSGPTNVARTQGYHSKDNPVGKYGMHRIIINSDILSADGSLNIDKTFAFNSLLHEGIHARMFERYKQGKFKGYPGHQDFLKRGGEGHHNQMGAFNRQELIDGMTEFDGQLTESGETVPEYHTADWYEAMSWYGLRRTPAWENFKKQNPKKATEYSKLISEQIKRNKKAINGK